MSGRNGDPVEFEDPASPILRRTGDPCVCMGTLIYTSKKARRGSTHMASDKGKKDGRFSFEEIHQYLLQGVYPSTFSKSDKQALRKRAKFFAGKGADL